MAPSTTSSIATSTRRTNANAHPNAASELQARKKRKVQPSLPSLTAKTSDATVATRYSKGDAFTSRRRPEVKPATRRAGIAAYGKVGKAFAKVDDSKKQQDLSGDSGTRKRKIVAIEAQEDEDGEVENRPPFDEDALVDLDARASTKRSKKTHDGSERRGLTETPRTKGARLLFEKLDFQKKLDFTADSPALPSSSVSSVSSNPSTPSKKRQRGYEDSNDGFGDDEDTSTAASSPPPPDAETEGVEHERKGNENSNVMPQELQDLTSLHTSFLTALSLHYAHNNHSNPIEVNELATSVQRIWKKRKVNVDDIRGVLPLSEPQDAVKQDGLFKLTDYGRGKLCLELTDAGLQKALNGRGGKTRFISEASRKMTFAINLRQRWRDHLQEHASGSKQQQIATAAEHFIQNLPLAPIRASDSLKHLNPLLSKGQRRLEDLKAGAIKAQERAAGQRPSEDKESSSAAVASPSLPQQGQQQRQTAKLPTTTSRASALLDRLHAKALHTSSLQAPPSSETIARRRALQRVTEIAPVISSLVVERQKHNNDDTTTNTDTATNTDSVEVMRQHTVSFTMPTMIQHLQMSLRNPISKDEGEKCVRCLAEVAPEWVEIKEWGKVCGVVVKGMGVGRKVVEERVGRVLEREGLAQ